MKFCWCTFSVKNLEESIKFYQEIVGLSLDRRFKAGPNTEIAFLGDGETKVELVCSEEKKEVNVGADISLGFEVKSVDEMMAFVKDKGIDILSGPISPNPHVKFFFVKDPNGLRIQFVENM
ncbi:lactoylglutathione lyase [Oxobacter pfennigii]|uniref:Lactoylglutathione lyase n=1 Tax=Oxobacter pfennigii TaxID=36849 RepID=A0A0N8NSM4_9CLOT|nr:VOC family protein [Oxobacter pfennigii]KPU42440.1 lactoylglutathione lyase [Oxobacter pfennigii]